MSTKLQDRSPVSGQMFTLGGTLVCFVCIYLVLINKPNLNSWWSLFFLSNYTLALSLWACYSSISTCLTTMLCLIFRLTELLAWLKSLTLCCMRNYSHPCRPEILEYKVGTMHVVDTGTPARMAAVCLWQEPLQSRAEQGCVKTAFRAVQLYIVLCSATTKWKESYGFFFFSYVTFLFVVFICFQSKTLELCDLTL